MRDDLEFADRMGKGFTMRAMYLVLVLGLAGLMFVPATETVPVPAEPAPADDGLYSLLKEGQNNRQKIGADETMAADFFARLNTEAGPFICNPKVAKDIVMAVTPLGLQGSIFSRTEAVKVIGRFPNSEPAVAALVSILKSSLGKGMELNDFLGTVCGAISACGQFSDQAAKGLFEVFNTRHGDVHLKVKEQALAALGNVRTMTSVTALFDILAKICPYPEEPNPHIIHMCGDDIKQQTWRTLNSAYYTALNGLTGENQTGGASGIYWRISQWKAWFAKNRTILAKRLAEEKQKALEKSPQAVPPVPSKI